MAKRKAKDPDPENPILKAIRRILGRPETLPPVRVTQRPPHQTDSAMVDSLLAAPFMQDTVRALLGGVDPRVRMSSYTPTTQDGGLVQGWVYPDTANRVNISPTFFGNDLNPRSQEGILSHEFMHIADLADRVDPRIFAGTNLEGNPGRRSPGFLGIPFRLLDQPKLEGRAYAFQDALELMRQGLDPDDEKKMKGVNPGVLQIMRNLREILGASEMASSGGNTPRHSP